MRKHYLLSFFTILSLTLPLAPLCALDNPPHEIRIELSTTSALSPLYCSKLFAEDGSFSSSYLKELQSVLDFDLSHNGKSRLITRSDEKEKILEKIKPDSTQMMGELKKISTSSIIKCSVKDKKIAVYHIQPSRGINKLLAERSLSGNLSSDRRQIHKMADIIFKELFHENGIAHSRVLFSFQRAIPDDISRSVSEIWECDWDGANAHAVTSEHAYCVTPVLVPKGGHFNKDMFLFVSYKTGQPKIFISSLDAGSQGAMKAVDLRGNQLLPAISLQRDKMAFICDASGRADLFVQPIKPENGKMGTPVQLFSYPRSTQASPSFSPDGKKIAFASDKDGSTRIYVIPSERGEKRGNPALITKKNRENSCPCWSPDGTKLAYSAKTDGIRQIWIYDFTSGEEKQLTFGGGNKENPYWASNSMHLVFNSTDGATSDLYVVNLNQPEAIKITQGPGKKHYPTWGPR